MSVTTQRSIRHVILPGLAFVAIAALFGFTDLDRMIARAWAFDAALGDFPARNAWWANAFLHDGGRHLMWAILFATAGTFIATFVAADWRAYRRPALFTFGAMVLATLTVNVLKALSNVDCPVDLLDFGGTLPYFPLLSHRPSDLPAAACFPGSHSSSGFALIAFYFALGERWPRAARIALATAFAVGTIFAFAQEARGAHFLSHDLWSGFIVWFVELGVYSWLFGGRLWARTDSAAAATDAPIWRTEAGKLPRARRARSA